MQFKTKVKCDPDRQTLVVLAGEITTRSVETVNRPNDPRSRRVAYAPGGLPGLPAVRSGGSPNTKVFLAMHVSSQSGLLKSETLVYS